MLNANEFFHDFETGYTAGVGAPAAGGQGAAPIEEEKAPPQPFLESLVGGEQANFALALERALQADEHKPVPHLPPVEEKRPPDLRHLKSMVDVGKREAANPQKRAVMVQAGLGLEFGNLDKSAEFQAFLAKARALQAAGLAGRELAKGTHPQVIAFLSDPITARVHKALLNVGGLSWRTVLAILQGVLYCNAEQRKFYRVWLETPLKRGNNKEIFDTDAVIAKLSAAGLAPGSFTAKQANAAHDHERHWYAGCIWVLSDFDEPVFYSHMGILGRFHHSSFLSGDRVAAAGEWRVDNGKIVWINGASGHYQPETWRFVKTLLVLERQGIPVGSVLLYRGREEAPLEVPWRQYIDNSGDYDRQKWKTWPD